MARLNIETTLWTNPRFQMFMIKTGDRHRAIGIVIDLWTLAQQYWCSKKTPRQLIPEEKWTESSLPESLIECGLAERRETGVYAKGSEANFQWWFDGIKQREEAGKKRASDGQRDPSGRWIAGPQTPAEASEIQPSSSSSSYKKDLNIVQRKRRTEYTEEFENLYSQYPRREGKAGGFKIYLKTIKTDQDRERLAIAIRNYADQIRREGREAQYTKQFSTFMNNWQDYETVPKTDISETRSLVDVRPI